MLADLLRFYRDAPGDLPEMGNMSIDEYLTRHRYGSAFRDDHLYPMAAAIWSTPAMDVGRYPAAQFVKFCHNHGLLLLRNRPSGALLPVEVASMSDASPRVLVTGSGCRPV